MTVGELRRLLAPLADDAPVLVRDLELLHLWEPDGRIEPVERVRVEHPPARRLLTGTTHGEEWRSAESGASFGLVLSGVNA